MTSTGRLGRYIQLDLFTATDHATGRAIVERALHTSPAATIPFDDNQSAALAHGLPLALVVPESLKAVALQCADQAITNRTVQSV